MKTYSSYDEFLCETLAKWWDGYFGGSPATNNNPWMTNSVVRRFAIIKAEDIYKALLKQPGISTTQAHILMLSDKFLDHFGRIMSALSSFTSDSAALPPAFIQETLMQRCKEMVQFLADTCRNDPEIIERTQKELIEMGIGQVPPPKLAGGGTGCGTSLIALVVTILFPPPAISQCNSIG